MTSPSIIFLDIDGVLCTQPSWKPEVMAVDGYSEFNPACVANLNALTEQTAAKVGLTSSRRMGKTVAEFQSIMQRRGFRGEIVDKINDALAPDDTPRPAELLDWLSRHGEPSRYLILDDDARLAALPARYRAHWVRTTYHRGFDATALADALTILATVD